MKKINTLKIGFLFGEELSQSETILTTELDGSILLKEYERLEAQYEMYKQVNTNNTLAYKNNLEDEECYIFFPEPVGIKKTTFLEIKLMANFLGGIDDELNEIKQKLSVLKKQREAIELYVNSFSKE